MTHWLFLPDDALDDLEILSGLSVERIETLRNYLDSNEFRPRYSFYVKVAELLGVSDESAAKLCSFLNHVHTQRTKLNREAASIPNEIEHFLNRVPAQSRERVRPVIEYVKSNKNTIVKLFSELPVRDLEEKIVDLESSPLPHLHTFRTYCDLRPVFDSGATKIVKYLPVITFSFSTHCRETDNQEQLNVQVSESQLSEVREAINRLDKKLVQVKAKHELIQKKEEGRS
jgi:hypothetical protein